MDLNQTIQTFLNQAVTLLGGLALAYLTFFVYKAKAKMDIEKNKIKDEVARALLGSALDRINDLVLKGVNSAQQAIVADLKAQISEGNASREDLLEIGRNVASTVYAQLTEPTINVLKLEINDIQKYITDTINTQILALKPTVITQVVISDSPTIADKTTTTVVESKSPVVVNVNPVESTVIVSPQPSSEAVEPLLPQVDTNTRVEVSPSEIAPNVEFGVVPEKN